MKPQSAPNSWDQDRKKFCVLKVEASFAAAFSTTGADFDIIQTIFSAAYFAV